MEFEKNRLLVQYIRRNTYKPVNQSAGGWFKNGFFIGGDEVLGWPGIYCSADKYDSPSASFYYHRSALLSVQRAHFLCTHCDLLSLPSYCHLAARKQTNVPHNYKPTVRYSDFTLSTVSVW